MDVISNPEIRGFHSNEITYVKKNKSRTAVAVKLAGVFIKYIITIHRSVVDWKLSRVEPV